MPHLILEYTANIAKNNFDDLFKECHTMLATELATDISGCKSRAIQLQDYYIGDGKPQSGFVHVTLKVLPSRSDGTLKNVVQRLMEILTDYFQSLVNDVSVQITIETCQLQHYQKNVLG